MLQPTRGPTWRPGDMSPSRAAGSSPAPCSPRRPTHFCWRMLKCWKPSPGSCCSAWLGAGPAGAAACSSACAAPLLVPAHSLLRASPRWLDWRLTSEAPAAGPEPAGPLLLPPAPPVPPPPEAEGLGLKVSAAASALPASASYWPCRRAALALPLPPPLLLPPPRCASCCSGATYLPTSSCCTSCKQEPCRGGKLGCSLCPVVRPAGTPTLPPLKQPPCCSSRLSCAPQPPHLLQDAPLRHVLENGLRCRRHAGVRKRGLRQLLQGDGGGAAVPQDPRTVLPACRDWGAGQHCGRIQPCSRPSHPPA